MTGRKLFILLVMGVIAFWQFSDGSLSNVFDNFSNQQEQGENEPELSSYEKTQLLDILENQAALIEEIKDARDYGNKGTIREFYEEILRLDKEYQELFETYEDELSNSDRNEISRKHYNISKSLPNFNSLMQ